MAAIIGALRGVLSLDSAAFESGAKRAQASMSGLQKSLTIAADRMQAAGKRLSVGLTGAVAATAAASVTASRQLTELRNAASVAGVTVQRLKELSIASKQFGVEQDKLSDILKDVNDKFGDFFQTGAGPLADFFDNIAPRVNLTRAAFQGLSSDQALQKYITALRQANVSQAEMTFYLEAIASDATLLLPAFDNGGAAIERVAQRARDLGLALEEGAISRAQAATAEFGILSEVLKTRLQVALADLLPAFGDLAATVTPFLERLASGAKALADRFAALSPEVKKFVGIGVAIAAAVGPAILALGLLAAALSALIASPVGLLVAVVGALATAGTALYLASSQSTDAIGAEVAELSRLAAALKPGEVLSREAAQSKLKEALARRENVRAMIEEAQQAALVSDQYSRNQKAIEGFQDALTALVPAGSDDGLVPSQLAESVEGLQRGLAAAYREQARLLAVGEEYAGQIAVADAQIEELRSSISAAARGMSTLGGETSAANGALNSASGAAGGLAGSLSSAASQAAILVANLGAVAPAVAALGTRVSAAISQLTADNKALTYQVQEGVSATVAGLKVQRDAALDQAAAAGLSLEQMSQLSDAASDQIGTVVKLETANEKLNKTIVATAKAAGGGGGGGGGAAKAVEKLTEAQKRAEDQAKSMASALLGPVTGAVDSVAGAFTDWLSGSLAGFKGFVDSILGSFKKLLADLINLAIANPIKIALGLAPGADGNFKGIFGSLGAKAAGGGATASGGGGLTGLLGGLGGFGKGLSSVISGFGSGGFSGAISAIGTALKGATTGLAGFATAVGAAVLPIGLAAAAFGALYKKPVTKQLESGVQLTISGFNAAALAAGDLADALDVTVRGYSRTKTEGGFLGSKNGFDKTTFDLGGQGAEVADGFRAALGQAFGSIKALGFGAGGFADYFAAQARDPYTPSIDLDGQSAEEQAATLAGWFNYFTGAAILYNGASQDLVDILDDVATSAERAADNMEEQLAQTLTRVADQVVRIGGTLDAFRLNSIGLGEAAIRASDGLAQLFGGVDAFVSGTNTFVDKFFSDAEKTEALTRQLTAAVSDLNLALPQSRAEYRALVEGADLATDAGRQTYAVLVQLADGFDRILPRAQALSAALEGLFTQSAGFVADQIAASQTLVSQFEQSAQAWFRVSDSLRDLLREIEGTSLGGTSGQSQLEANRAAFNAAVRAAKEGDAGAAAGLPALARSLLTSARATAQTGDDYRFAAAQVRSQLSLLGGVAGLEGGTDQAIASLYREQIAALEDLSVALEDGTLTRAELRATNTRLAGLSTAIETLDAFSYADLEERFRVAVNILPRANIPDYLKDLIGDETGRIKRQVDFLLRKQELTPDLLFLGVTQASEHLKTIKFLVRDKQLDLRTKKLALATASTLRKQVRFIVDSDLEPGDKRLALASSSDLTRSVGAVLDRGRSNPKALRLALQNVSDVAVGVTAALDGAVPRRVRQLVFDQTGTYTASVEAVLATDRLGARVKRLILKQQGDYITNVVGVLARDDVTQALKETLLNANVAGARALTIAATIDGVSATERELLTQKAARVRRTIRAIVNPNDLSAEALLFLGTFAGAAGDVLTRTVTGKVSGLDGLSDYEKFVLQTTVAPLSRAIRATFPGLAGLGPRQSVLLRDELATLVRPFKTDFSGLRDLTDRQALVLTTGTDRLDTLTREISANVTVKKPGLLNTIDRILGAGAGTVTITGGVALDLGATFGTTVSAAIVSTGLTSALAALKDALIADTASRRAAADAARALSDRQNIGIERAAVQRDVIANTESNIAKFFAKAEEYGVDLLGKGGKPASIQVIDGKLVSDYVAISGDGAGAFKRDVLGSGLSDDIFRRSGLIDAAAALERARNQVRLLGGVPAFAFGGAFAGGLRLVGERGPELEATGPSRIYSAQRTRELLSGGGGDLSAIKSELAALRQLLFAIEDHTETSARLARKADKIGLLERTA